jgi:Xaa-Pro aminopeptidase
MLMDLKFRLQSLRKNIDFSKIDAVFISNTPNIAYLTSFTNFSSEEREAYLIITKSAQYIITDGRYSEAVRKEVPEFKVIERSIKTPFKEILSTLAKRHSITTLGIEEFNLTVAEFKSLKKHFKKIVNQDTSYIRVQKDQEEANRVEAACDLADQALKHTLTKIKEGIAERELALEFEQFLMRNFAGVSFSTIVAFGPHSSVPHHETGDTKLSKKDGKFILIDCGSKLNSYCSDMTRTFFYGQPDQKHIDIYNAVLEAQTKAANFLDSQIKAKKEVKGADVDKVARDTITALGFEPYSHGLGHGTGLEIHEAPRLSVGSKDLLKEGMVFSIEPGIYIEEFGGVRIEDLYIIEKDGLRQLTKSPKNLQVI